LAAMMDDTSTELSMNPGRAAESAVSGQCRPDDGLAEKSPRVMVVTYGCQMNVFDSRRMIQVLGHAGYVETDDPAAADVIIFNTCSVRDRPEKKVLGSLSRLLPLKEIKPVLFGVAGCVAQQHGQALLDRVPYLDFVIGPDNIADLPDVVTRAASGRRTSSATWMDPRSYDFIPLDADVEAGPVAFLTIIKGCDNFCSYCMVPYVRGREVSKPAGLVLDEVGSLVKAGISEVTLLGQNVNSWGRGLEGNPTFPDLLEAVSAVPGLKRLRFVTSHPADASDRLLDLFGRLPNLAEYLHLPMQSGSDDVLARMGRRYTFAEYFNRIERVRAACPDVALSTDIIVGFPGETAADFESTMDAVRRCQFDLMFSFKYSPRPGTAAASWKDDVPEAEKAARLAALQAMQDGITKSRMQRFLGRVEEVLVEGPSRDSRKDGALQIMGRTRTNYIVNFTVPGGRVPSPGELVDVRIERILAHCLKGVVPG